MRRPLTDIALLSYIAKQHADVISYSEATRACKSSSSASRALHQLIREGLIEPRPKLVGLRYVTEYSVTQKGKEVAGLALQLTQLRQSAPKIGSSSTSSPSSPPKRVRSQDDSKRARKKKKHKSSRSSSSTSSNSEANTQRSERMGKLSNATVSTSSSSPLSSQLYQEENTEREKTPS
jgi:DNA-binding PadR family transcriptional regulator